jgi:multicomponent Na+:H+ antiporter subunit D
MMLFKRLSHLAINLIPLASLPGLFAALFIVNNNFTQQAFLVLTTAIWFIAALYARSYLASDTKRIRFYLFFLLTMIGNLGVLLSQDVSSFIGFFALMSFSAYPLILHSGSDEAKSAAAIYIKWVVFGEVILFAALAGKMYYAYLSGYDEPQVWVTAFLLIGFGVKAGLATLHVWLPKAHPVAPVPASALLSAVMVKVGLFGWIQFLPLGEEAIPVLAQPMMALGFSAAFLAAVYGFFQDNAKTVLAYSTVSQLGIISASIGFALAYPASWELLLPAITFFALHHGIAKATLFFTVGLKTDLTRNNRLTPVLWLLILIPAVSLIGLPLSTGAIAKASLKNATSDWPLFSSLLVFTAIGTSLLMGRFIELMRKPTKPEPTSAEPQWGLIVPTVLSALLSMGLLYATPSFEIKSYLGLWSTFNWAALWPASAGITIVLASSKLRANITAPVAGDLLIIYQKIGLLLVTFLQRVGQMGSNTLTNINNMLNNSVIKLQSLANSLNNHLAVDAPGTVMAAILAALLYTFFN